MDSNPLLLGRRGVNPFMARYGRDAYVNMARDVN